MKKIRRRYPGGGEQDWINEVYLWEKLDIGLEYNVRTAVVQVTVYYSSYTKAPRLNVRCKVER